jgi:hypothetical protein
MRQEKTAVDGMDKIPLTRLLPPGSLRSILEKAGKNEKRNCILSAVLVVYVVVGMALWREETTAAVFRRILFGVDYIWKVSKRFFGGIGTAAICMARKRLGYVAMRIICDAMMTPLAGRDPETPGCFFKGYRIVAVDGFRINVSDNEETARYFGYPHCNRGETAFPQARVLGLVEAGAQAVIGARVGPHSVGEQPMFKELIDIGKINGDMVVLADRNFYGFPLWKAACETGAALVWRVKKNITLKMTKKLADGSYLAMVYANSRKPAGESMEVRVVNYRVNINGKAGKEKFMIITNIVNEEIATAKELAELYSQRWEAEIVFSDVKKSFHTRADDLLVRSKCVVTILQELYGYLLAHYIIRKLMFEASLINGEDPDLLSFKGAAEIIELFSFQMMSLCKYQRSKMYIKMIEAISKCMCSKSRGKLNKRGVRRKYSKYAVRRRGDKRNIVVRARVVIIKR